MYIVLGLGCRWFNSFRRVRIEVPVDKGRFNPKIFGRFIKQCLLSSLSLLSPYSIDPFRRVDDRRGLLRSTVLKYSKLFVLPLFVRGSFPSMVQTLLLGVYMWR